jgi:predicted PurR-regulated permease PerM
MAVDQDQEVVSYVKKVLIVIGLVILAGVLVYAVRGSLTIVLLIYAGVILGVLLNRSTCWLARRARLPAGIALTILLMTFIPNLGPMLAFFPIGVVALAEEPPKLVHVAFFYILVQSLEGLVLTPLIHRKMITLPPALVIAVQILLLQLVGLVGVILAMPLVACAIVAVQSIYTEEILGDPREAPGAAPACGRADGG